MSTKIYDGFKIDTNDIFEVQRILGLHHNEMKEITSDKISDFIIKLAVDSFDQDTIDKKDTKQNYLSKANREMMDRQREVRKTRERDPLVDFEAEIAIFPFENSFYGIYYSEQKEFYDNLIKQEKVSEFSYFNNTDRPKHIKAKEWKDRERIWDAIFEGNSLPCEAGFTKKYNSNSYGIDIDALLDNWQNFIPKYEKRIKYWSSIIYADREFKKLQPEEKNIISTYMRIDRDDSEQAQAAREEIKNELRDLLVKDLNLEILGLPLEVIEERKALKEKKNKLKVR